MSQWYRSLIIAIAIVMATAAIAAALTPVEVGTRVDEMQARIDNGIRNGAIEAESARLLNFRLEAVRRGLRHPAGAKPSEAELRDLTARLDALEPMVPRSMPPKSPEGRIEGQFAVFESVIAEGVSSRSIIPIAAKALRSELGSIKGEFDTARQRGPLSDNETARLELRLQRLAERIKSYAAPRRSR